MPQTLSNYFRSILNCNVIRTEMKHFGFELAAHAIFFTEEKKFFPKNKSEQTSQFIVYQTNHANEVHVYHLVLVVDVGFENLALPI